MIKNEKQFQITNKCLRDLLEALKDLKGKTTDDAPKLLLEAEINGVKSQIREFRSEIRQYKRLKTVTQARVDSIFDIGIALIKARIMNNLTQEQLGYKVGMAMQQIQRYEDNNYANAALHTISEIAEVLGLTSTKVTIRVNTTN